MPEGLNAAPFQNLTPFTVGKIAYYVGDVNRTRPARLSRFCARPPKTGSPYKTVDVCDHGSAQKGEGMETVDEVRCSDHTTILLPLSTMRAI